MKIILHKVFFYSLLQASAVLISAPFPALLDDWEQFPGTGMEVHDPLVSLRAFSVIFSGKWPLLAKLFFVY